MSEFKPHKGEQQPKDLKIQRKNPNDVKSVFVNDFIVTHTESEFYLTFSVIEPLPILDKEELENIENIEASAVAKFVITPNFAKKIADVLASNYKIFKDKAESLTEDEHDTKNGTNRPN